MISNSEKTYDVFCALPNNGQRVLCYGHLTHCCYLDMDEFPEWHVATFELIVTMYKLKDKVPEDPEESILLSYKVQEQWSCGNAFFDGFIIGVTKWKKITEEEAREK